MVAWIFRPPRWGIVFVLLALLGFLIAGCAGSQEKSAPPVAGSFVGEAPDANAFVAIVASKPDQGGEAREVRAYLCDGHRVNEWFTGSAEGNDLDLTSDGGAELKGNLAPDSSTGQVTLPDGKSFAFTASPPTGIAGLFDVTTSDDGQLLGTSQTGAQLEGRVASEPQENSAYPVTGTITPPDDQPQDFRLFANTAEAGEFRWIVLYDERVKGAKKGKDTAGAVDGFMW